MDDKSKGLLILKETILKNLRHTDYEHVTKLAEEYYDIFTGSNIKKYLKRIVKREDDALFEQRFNIFQTTIPASVENLSQMFNKPLRSNRIFSSIDHPDSKARNEIIERMSKFYQGESDSGVDAYLRERWKSLNIYDPNAYIAVEFSAFDPVKEKTYPFPLEYSSKEAIRPHYKNGTLDWMICQTAIEYSIDDKDKSKKEKGSRYIMYLDNSAIVLIQVHKDKRITDIKNPNIIEVLNEKGEVHSAYVMLEYNTKSGGIPLFRAGYKKDPVTYDRTCVSIIHSAMPFFKKELKTGSEFDLTMSLHAFPVRVQYGKRCEGDKDRGQTCKDGLTASGKVCSICGGSKVISPVATSTQDIIYVLPPKNGEPVLDLEKAFIYKTPPTEFVKFQEDYLSRLIEKAKGAVFAAEVVQKKTVGQTATELDYSYDNVYDVFYPFGEKYSYAWRFIIRMIAIYTDNNSDKLSIYHLFPKDLKLKNLGVLLSEAKMASESGLSQHAINAINNDVMEAMYADDQSTLTKIKIKDRFHPFSGKSAAEIQSILMGGEILPFYKVLYQYFDIIFDDIDSEMGDRFYLMSYGNQKAEIKRRVDKLLQETEDNKAKKLSNMRLSLNLPTDGEEETTETA